MYVSVVDYSCEIIDSITALMWRLHFFLSMQYFKNIYIHSKFQSNLFCRSNKTSCNAHEKISYQCGNKSMYCFVSCIDLQLILTNYRQCELSVLGELFGLSEHRPEGKATLYQRFGCFRVDSHFLLPLLLPAHISEKSWTHFNLLLKC